jgi:predicted dienelactone hydrolase
MHSEARTSRVETTDMTGRWITAAVVTLACALVVAWPRATAAQSAPPAASHPVGIRQLEFVDQGRHLALAVFYPAVVRDRAAVPLVMPFFDKLKSYRDVEVASEGAPFPLVVFSHGRGSNGLYYSWFAEFLASRGYIVAALNHYRANTYDSTIAYLANKLWQRPLDVGLTISFLLNDPVWVKSIDAARIGVAGHSQGGHGPLDRRREGERPQVSRLPARLA